jgi:hypothetical protein
MLKTSSASAVIDRLYAELLERGIGYFLPSARLRVEACFGGTRSRNLTLVEAAADCAVINWLGYEVEVKASAAFTEGELQLLQAIGQVLQRRHTLIVDRSSVMHSLELFGGIPEDRYVSAFLDPQRLEPDDGAEPVHDRVADAVEVLRISALTTYENRRISTGALLFGNHPDPCHEAPSVSPDALRYSKQLTASRSFHRLCDGLQTLALVDQNGSFSEIVDVQQWADPFTTSELPVPGSARYSTHSRATLCGGHICLILTPYGEIKVFSAGAQVFRFIDGRWRLTDAPEKYRAWRAALADSALAERLFSAAMNLAEDRRGGLFVVLNDGASARALVADGDLFHPTAPPHAPARAATRDQFHYLLQGRRVTDLPSSILETVARIDGAIVLDPEANMLAFGAILHNKPTKQARQENVEGGRTAAAIAASQFGKVLKVSEDGLVAFYQDGVCVWEM